MSLRTRGPLKTYSDLDLAFVSANGKLGMQRSAELALAFSESDLPYRVDVVDYHSADPEFRAIIDSASGKIWAARCRDRRVTSP